MKKFITVFMVLLLVTSFVGCGQSSAESEDLSVTIVLDGHEFVVTPDTSILDEAERLGYRLHRMSEYKSLDIYSYAVCYSRGGEPTVFIDFDLHGTRDNYKYATIKLAIYQECSLLSDRIQNRSEYFSKQGFTVIGKARILNILDEMRTSPENMESIFESYLHNVDFEDTSPIKI